MFFNLNATALLNTVLPAIGGTYLLLLASIGRRGTTRAVVGAIDNLRDDYEKG